ncbi:MAG: tetratricopeptide repeat protein [Planctomycetota bacterium]
MALIALAFWNSLRGEWVYDDKTQIVENHFVQHPRFLGKALVSDVWGFKGDKGKTWSNYWRPTFVIWLTANYQLFGLETPGWHITSILAHALVTWLVFLALRRLRLDPVVCAIATWVFAVHPVHVESVTWISGVTDVLLSAFLLTAYLLHLRSLDEAKSGLRLMALLAYALALLSKEAAVTFPAIIFLTHWIRSESVTHHRFKTALMQALPYAALVLVYVPVRYLILGQMRQDAPGAPGVVGMLATAPSLILFYIRQSLFPVFLGPDNPLRPVTNSNIGLINFVLPLVVLAILFNVLRPMVCRSTSARLGLIWFVIPLMLAVDIRVFLPDQIVNNRYLYLSVMGAFIMVASAMLHAARAIWPDQPRRAARMATIFGLLIAVTMTPLTMDYNRAWCNEIALWQRGIKTDPASSHSYHMLGVAYRMAHRMEDARSSLERAIELNPEHSFPYVELARVQLADGLYSRAEENLRKVLSVRPELSFAWELLASCFEQQKKYAAAIGVFREAIAATPYFRPRYAKNIAVLHYLAGRKAQALSDLESLRPDLELATTEDVLEAWFYLGSLYAEQNRHKESIEAFQRYMTSTEGIPSKAVLARQNECRQIQTGMSQP